MKDETQLKVYPLRLDYSSEESEPTDYGADPYVYSNMWEYVFSAIGVCVGFGAFWRFPYLVYKHGGGVFLIPYMLAMVLLGMPLFYLETAVGQMHRMSLPSVFKRIHPSLKVIGLAITSTCLHFTSLYNILMTYCYRFMFTSFESPLPFAEETITENNYFHDVILEQSSSINDFQGINPFLFAIYVVSLLICHMIVKDGAKTSGKIVIVTATAPFVIFLILVVRGLFLSGATQGIVYLFRPKWQKLWTPNIWIDATTQVFYQLAIGVGTIINISSQKARREDILKSVLIVPISLVACGLLSALTIFIYLSHFCVESGYSIDDPNLSLSGVELSFNVLPKALMLLPMPNLWIFVFFFTMVLLGIDSEFGMLEALYCCVRDELKDRHVTIFGFNLSNTGAQYLLLCVVCIGAPTLTSHAGIYYLGFYDYFISNIPFTLWCTLELFFFVHVFKFKEMAAAIKRYTKTEVPGFIRYCLESYWLPAYLVINLLLAFFNQVMAYQRYSVGFYIFGWLITLYPIILSIWWLRREWRGWGELKLTFYAIENRDSYL